MGEYFDMLVQLVVVLLPLLALGFLVWCYKKITQDSDFKMPDKMTLDILESDKIPTDWTNLDGSGEDLESGEDNSSDEEEAVGGHTHSHNGEPCHGHEPPKQHVHSHNGVPCHGHGGGPGGPGGRNVDPKTMKLMMLEMIRKKRSALEEAKEDGEVTDEQYEHHKKGLAEALANVQKMPTDPETIKKLQEAQREKMRANMMKQMAAKKAAYIEAMKKKQAEMQAQKIKEIENDEEIETDSSDDETTHLPTSPVVSDDPSPSKNNTTADEENINVGVHLRPRFVEKKDIAPASKGIGEFYAM